ncbi:MAG: hypothetical protein ACMXYK_05935 [Candidatus Woesearchaeota archaeon]
MVVEFSKQFLKSLKKYCSKKDAKNLVLQLSKTSPSDGDFVALVGNIIIREKRRDSFRFYFIIEKTKKHVITKEELNDMLLLFIALSKKNNQQKVIDDLKKGLQKKGFKF